MSRYESNTPRAAFALAAIAMTALTFGLAVSVPASVDHANLATAARKASRAPTEVAIIPSRIEVIGVREQSVAVEHEAPVKRSDRPS
jgi:hypothetical protein